jgi:hypothetical protein
MDHQRTNRKGGRLLTAKKVASWLVVSASAITLTAFWHFLVFHSLDLNPPLFWVCGAGASLALGFAYMLISVLESLNSQKWRFSLSAMLAAMTVVAVTLGLVVYAIRK